MEYQLKRSKRKTLSIEITRDCRVIVRAPLRLPQKQIDAFLQQKAQWIEKNLSEQREQQAKRQLTDEQIEELKRLAKAYLPGRTAEFARQMGVEYTSLKITGAKTRYGSCSSKNGICFSYYVMQKPLYAVDYVIVHELAHTVHHDHSKRFYALIERYMPDYKERIRVLKQ